MIILGLDPGEATGFALIDISPDGIGFDALSYGTIPQLKPGIAGLLDDVWNWLEEEFHRWHPNELAFEEFIPTQKMRTTREAGEVRGVIRLYAERHYQNHYHGYFPNTVRSILQVANKPAARKFVESLLGFKVKQPDHTTDAFSIAITHGVEMNALRSFGAKAPDFTLTRKLGGKKPKTPDPAKEYSRDELAQLLMDGKIRVGRRS